MTSLSAHTLDAFEEELLKTANKAALLGRVGQFLKGQAGAGAAGVGAGGALGAAGGGAIGGLKGYRDARDAGATRGQSALYALQKGLGGAAKGGLLGAAAGGAAGLAGGGKARELAQGLVQKERLGAPSRFMQRQVHSLTGYADKAGLRAMRGGSYGAEQQYNQALKNFQEAYKGGAKPGWVDKAKAAVTGKAPTQRELNSKAFEAARKKGLRAEAGLQAARQAEDAGLTSVPGIVKGLAGQAELGGKKLNPLQAAKTMVGEQWHGSGLGGKAMMVGFPASGVVGSLTGPSNPDTGRVEGIGKALGSGLAYASPLALTGQLALAGGLGGAAGLVGAGADTRLRRSIAKRRKVRGELPPAKTGPEPSEENAAQPERLYSNAALGRPPEDMSV